MNQVRLYVPVMLTTPEGLLVFERRTDDASYEGGKLGMFGGGAKPGETVEECLRRELRKETSLDLDAIGYWHDRDYTIPAGEYPVARNFSLYRGVVPDMNFQVYEGVRAEAYRLDELPDRTDLMATSVYLLRTVLKLY